MVGWPGMAVAGVDAQGLSGGLRAVGDANGGAVCSSSAAFCKGLHRFRRANGAGPAGVREGVLGLGSRGVNHLINPSPFLSIETPQSKLRI